MNSETERPILLLRPAKRYFWFAYLFVWLLIPMVVIYVRRRSLAVYFYNDKIMVEKGFLAKQYIECYYADIKMIDVQQRVPERILGLGRVNIATAGTDGYEIQLWGMIRPLEIKKFVLAKRRQALESTV